MTDTGFVTVSDVNLTTAGAAIWWKLRDKTTRDKLEQALQNSGISEERWYLPEEPSAERCLRRALKELKEYRRLIRPLKGKKGWAIVHEDATEDDMEHATIVVARIDSDGCVRWKPTDRAYDQLSVSQLNRMEDEVLASYQTQRNILNHGDMSQWLLRQVHNMNAVTLRDGGGVYFVPPSHVPHWQSIGEVLKAIGASRAYSLQAVKALDAMEAVFDALQDEAIDMVDKIREKLEEERYGVRALQNRVVLCEDFVDKVARYEKFLGTSMGRIHEQVEELKTDLGAAIMAAEEDDEDVRDLLGVA